MTDRSSSGGDWSERERIAHQLTTLAERVRRGEYQHSVRAYRDTPYVRERMAAAVLFYVELAIAHGAGLTGEDVTHSGLVAREIRTGHQAVP